MSLSLFLSCISLGVILLKNVKNRGFGNKIKRGGIELGGSAASGHYELLFHLLQFPAPCNLVCYHLAKQ